MGLYANDGSIRVSVVDGNTYTGLYALDGSINMVKSDGSHFVGLYHPCGAWNATLVTSGAVAYYALDGSVNVMQSPYSATGAMRVTTVSGSFSGSSAARTFYILGF